MSKEPWRSPVSTFAPPSPSTPTASALVIRPAVTRRYSEGHTPAERSMTWRLLIMATNAALAYLEGGCSCCSRYCPVRYTSGTKSGHIILFSRIASDRHRDSEIFIEPWTNYYIASKYTAYSMHLLSFVIDAIVDTAPSTLLGNVISYLGYGIHEKLPVKGTKGHSPPAVRHNTGRWMIERRFLSWHTPSGIYSAESNALPSFSEDKVRTH